MKSNARTTETENHCHKKSKKRIGRDAIFKSLSNNRRRLVLSYLLEQEDPVNIKELSRVVAAQENGIAIDEVTHEQRKRAYIALYQNHLPFLEENGLIDSGRSMNTIELTDCAPLLKSYLNPVSGRPTSLVTADLVIIGFGFLLVTLRWAELYPFSSIPQVVYAAAILAAMTVVTALRFYRVRSDQSESGSLTS